MKSITYLVLPFLLMNAQPAETIDAFKEATIDREQEFAENQYEGNGEPVVYLEGTSSFVITVPHAVKHIRGGSPKDAEIYTGALAKWLHEETGAHVIYSSEMTDDPHDNRSSDFKEKLADVVNSHDIEMVVDLHGASGSRDFDVDLGTMGRESVSRQVIGHLRASLQEAGVEGVKENHTFTADSPLTITNYAYTELQVPAVQIEINQIFRDPRSDIASFQQLYNGLYTFLTMYEAQYFYQPVPFCRDREVSRAAWKNSYYDSINFQLLNQAYFLPEMECRK